MEGFESILKTMQDKYKQLTGFEPNEASDIGIRLNILAGELADAYTQLNSFKTQIFPQTASGEYLDLHAKCRGIERKNAVSALGVLRFSRTTASGEDIEIPAGIICSTAGDNALRFETTQAAVLKAGSLYADIPARALTAGAKANAAVGTVAIMITPAQGISSVNNISAFSGGIDEESDENLRKRLVQTFTSISNGTNAAFYHKEALSFDFVTSAYVLPRERGLGTVDIAVTKNGAALSADELKQVQDRMNALKEISADVLVRNAEPVTAGITVELTPQNGYSFAALQNSCSKIITDFISGLGVGKPLLRAVLYKQLMSCGGVYNCNITLPAADVKISSDEVIVPGGITISAMAVTA